MTLKLQYNPRFAIYARAHGHTPEQQLQHDTEAWKLGHVFGFMAWLSKHFDEFSAETGIERADIGRPEHIERFTRWLDARYPK